MRYEIGQEIHVVSFYNTDHKFRGRQALPSASLQSEATLTHRFAKLSVVEHHKVAWDQNPNGAKEHNGFILKDSDGNVYHNQYPTAAYGQMTTEADNYFLRKPSEGQRLADLVGQEGTYSYVDIEYAYEFCFNLIESSIDSEKRAFYKRRLDELTAYLLTQEKQVLRVPIWEDLPDILTSKIFPIQKG